MYYQEDKRIGQAVFLDGVNVYDAYNADLIEYIPVAGRITTDFIHAPGQTKFNLLSFDAGQSGMQFSFYVGGEDDADAARNVSKFIKAAQACVFTIENDPLEYVCIMQSYNDVMTGVGSYHQVTVTYAAIKRSPLKTAEGITTTAGDSKWQTVKNVNNGTEPTGVKITFTTGETVYYSAEEKIIIRANNVQTHQIKFTNVQPNSTYIIDGIEGTVTRNGINCFGDTDMLEFPKLLPGDYRVSTLNKTESLEIEYYELFT